MPVNTSPIIKDKQSLLLFRQKHALPGQKYFLKIKIIPLTYYLSLQKLLTPNL